ncbi:phage tail sheath C-terminal domain-containing protein [Kribbella sp. CA-253562]|uniref:phage tail sheath family protein n=1 Tax=Kribbella sp. CA-253562 TaxID=3239942 RepID=UPI003D8F72C7
MAFNIGVNVVEVDGSAAPSITGAAVSVAGFTVLTERGVPGRPARVTSFVQFAERFGGYFRGGLGAYLVKGFFDNGGQTAYINRIVDADPKKGAKAATAALKDDGGTTVLEVAAGYRGRLDPGDWGKRLFVRVRHSSSATSVVRESEPASITGAALGGATVDMTDAPKLEVFVDGAEGATEIEFDDDDFADRTKATPEEIRDAINRGTSLLRASVAPGAAPQKLVLTSTGVEAAGSTGRTSLRVAAANAKLGFGAGTSPTPGTLEQFAAGGTRLQSTEGFAVGDALVITATKPGATPGQDPVPVVATGGHRTISSIDGATGAVKWTPNIGNIADFSDTATVTVANAEFDLLVADGAADEEHVVETHLGLTLEPELQHYASRVLNHPVTGSRFLRLADVAAATRDRPKAEWTALQGGSDGSPKSNHFIGDEAEGTGFFAFSPYDIQLLCCERADVVISKAALAYCEKRGDAMFVGSVLEGLRGEDAVRHGKLLQTRKSYGALYGPWIIVPDPAGLGDNPRITIPPVGHVMGVYARIETSRGIWKAPAGDEANLLGVLDTEYQFSDTDHTDLVVNGSVNGIRPVPRAGIVVDASRTLSTDPRWRYVNVRLLFNYVKSSLREGLRSARQEPNRESLWNAVKFGTITPFLMGLWRQGAFGTGTPEQTFTVVVDATNNPPDQVAQGRLTVEAYFYPGLPAETIVIICGQQPSGVTVAEA